MQILSISSAASTATVLNPVAVSRSTAASSSASSTPANASSGTAATSTASTTSSAKTSRSGGGGGGGSSAAQEVQQATSFSTTVAGKQYSGSVNQSNGQYTASIPGLAGASASASSMQAAEDALTLRINEIV